MSFFFKASITNAYFSRDIQLAACLPELAEAPRRLRDAPSDHSNGSGGGGASAVIWVVVVALGTVAAAASNVLLESLLKTTTDVGQAGQCRDGAPKRAVAGFLFGLLCGCECDTTVTSLAL